MSLLEIHSSWHDILFFVPSEYFCLAVAPTQSLPYSLPSRSRGLPKTISVGNWSRHCCMASIPLGLIDHGRSRYHVFDSLGAERYILRTLNVHNGEFARLGTLCVQSPGYCLVILLFEHLAHFCCFLIKSRPRLQALASLSEYQVMAGRTGFSCDEQSKLLVDSINPTTTVSRWIGHVVSLCGRNGLVGAASELCAAPEEMLGLSIRR